MSVHLVLVLSVSLGIAVNIAMSDDVTNSTMPSAQPQRDLRTTRAQGPPLIIIRVTEPNPTAQPVTSQDVRGGESKNGGMNIESNGPSDVLYFICVFQLYRMLVLLDVSRRFQMRALILLTLLFMNAVGGTNLKVYDTSGLYSNKGQVLDF